MALRQDVRKGIKFSKLAVKRKISIIVSRQNSGNASSGKSCKRDALPTSHIDSQFPHIINTVLVSRLVNTCTFLTHDESITQQANALNSL